MEAALQESAEMLGTAEFQFFCITIQIQRETGGNLAETLANLSDVLRKRAQMKLKIRAMSSEAKASAYIVGALPRSEENTSELQSLMRISYAVYCLKKKN